MSAKKKENKTKLTCRPGPLQSGLSLPMDLTISPLHVPCTFMENGGGTSADRKKRKQAVNYFLSIERALYCGQRKASTDLQHEHVLQLAQDHLRSNHLSLD